MKPMVRACGTVLVALVYLLLVLPVGLITRLARDPLRRRPDPAARSYWIYRETHSPTPGMPSLRYGAAAGWRNTWNSKNA
jgi:hypothetical protein